MFFCHVYKNLRLRQAVLIDFLHNLANNNKLSSMKKLFHLFTLCVLFSAGIVVPASASLANAKTVISEEPEPHPNTIYVKLKLNGNTVYLPVLVFPSDSVGDVKDAVSGITGIPSDSFNLYYNGQELDEELTLAFYGIGSGAILNAY
jgi:hypothetical protein